MKRMIGLLVLVAALGVWSGVQAWSGPSFWMRIQAAAAILASVNLLFLTWLWSRARAGSSEALFFPEMILLSVAGPINVVPSLLWPTREASRSGPCGAPDRPSDSDKGRLCS